MTDESPALSAPSEIDKIRESMQAEFAAFKESMSKELDARDSKIAELTKTNDELRASLVRNTFVQPAPEPPKEPTKEELYQAEIDKLVARTNDLIKQELTRSY